MEKYRYYNKIKTQLYIIEKIFLDRISGDLKFESDIDLNSLYGPNIFKRLYILYNRYDAEIDISFDSKYHKIKIEDKYKQDMLNLFEHR